nr:RICIN domain-containing protein [Pedobacter borealis]
MGNASTDNSPLEQRTYSGSGNEQLWTLTNIGTGLIKLTNVQNGKAIQIANASTSNSAAGQIGTYNALANQHFSLASTDNGYFRITPLLASGMGLEVNGGSSADGATLAQYSYSGSTNQQWKFEPTPTMQSLPAKLTSFTAKINADKNVSIQWATATESKNDYFLIEKSMDGKNFNKLGSNVSAKGSNSSYTIVDKNASVGNNYYRLTQVDKYGQNEITPTTVVNFGFNNFKNLIFPNPLKDKYLTIKTETGNEIETVEIFSTIGAKILSKKVTKDIDNSYHLVFNNKPPEGIYLIKVGKKYIGKLIVQ